MKKLTLYIKPAAIKKIRNTALLVIGIILLLLFAFFVVVQLPSVQTWLAKKTASYLSDQLHTRVTIGHLLFKPFSSLEIKDLYIEDQQKDTLIFVPLLDISILNFSLRRQKISLGESKLVNARIGLSRLKTKGEYNFDFIIHYFSSDSKDTNSGKWNVKASGFKLINTKFTYRDFRNPGRAGGEGINWDDLSLTGLNTDINNIRLFSDSVQYHLNNLSFSESSGFHLYDFKGDVMMSDKSWDFRSAIIKTDKSYIDGNFRLYFESVKDLSEFIEKVNFKSEFKNSHIASSDLVYFSDELKGLQKTISFKGKIKGTIKHLKGKDLEIFYSGSTYFKGNVVMDGLPDISETYMEIDVKDMCVNADDLFHIPQYPFISHEMIFVPSSVSSLGNIHFNGRFNGFYNDFVAYGNTSTAIGYLTTDINLKIADSDKQTVYSGNFSAREFNAGRLFGSKELGSVTMKAKVEGRGFTLKNVDAALEGHVDKIDFLNYAYTGIQMKGHFSKKLFDGDVSINDPNLLMDFQGDIDFNKKIPSFNFITSVKRMNPTVLHLVDRDSSAFLSADMKINLNAENIDNATGAIEISKLLYAEKNDTLKSGKLTLNTENTGERSVEIHSDFMDAMLNGNFTFSGILNAAEWVVSQYIPGTINTGFKKKHEEDIRFNVVLKNTEGITKLFFPDLTVSPATRLSGQMNTMNEILNTTLVSDQVVYKNTLFENIHIDGKTASGKFLFETSVKDIIIRDSIKIDDLRITGNTNRDSSGFRLTVEGKDSLKTRADIFFSTNYLPNGKTKVKLAPEYLVIGGHNWDINPANNILIDTSGVLIQELDFSSEGQVIKLDGLVSHNPADQIKIDFTDFSLSQLNQLLAAYSISIGGVVNGAVFINDLYHEPAMQSSLKIETLQWFNDTLGDAEINTDWNAERKVVIMEASVTRGGLKNILIQGEYALSGEGDRLNFDINLKKTYLQAFAPYLKDIFSNISGVASAELKLKGTLEKPELTGTAYLQKVGFTIDYLKTSYAFSSQVTFEKNAIVFEKVKVFDEKGTPALVNGKIYHDHLSDFYFDINIDADHNEILNTTAADNELYYGTAFASGKVNIAGFVDYIKFDIGLRSEKGTKINIPLSNPAEVSSNSFITFINSKKDTVSKSEILDDSFDGIALNMDFDVTTDAFIYLVFDSKIGDVIEGNGKGTISMTMSPTEDLKMFGNYQIEQGKYLFTMQNVINKPFLIENGGYVRWSGDPYDATIDIYATYRRKAGLYDLFQDSSFKKLVPVDLRLHLKDKLFNPAIGFDIVVKNLDPNTENQVKRLINTDEEKYRQAVSLLVMGRFTAPLELSNRSLSNNNAVGFNAYELLSNQLSNWASQISRQVNVGVNYRPADNITKEELEIALSTSILNDRVTIDVNGGLANTTNSNNQNASNLVGDFNVEVKASKDGRVRLKAFNRSNNNSLINNINSPYTQGVGIFYREEFNSLSELRRRFSDLFRKKKEGNSVE